MLVRVPGVLDFKHFVSFFRNFVNYLGRVKSRGLSPDPQKIDSGKLTVPISVKEVRTFLCLAGSYRKFIPNFGKIAKNSLHKSNVWSDERAFRLARGRLDSTSSTISINSIFLPKQEQIFVNRLRICGLWSSTKEEIDRKTSQIGRSHSTQITLHESTVNRTNSRNSLLTPEDRVKGDDKATQDAYLYETWRNMNNSDGNHVSVGR